MDPIQALLLQANRKIVHFPDNSRYRDTDTAVATHADGEPVVYLRRRIVPQPDSLRPLRRHEVRQGDRLDNVTYEHLNDPELYWQLCDANGTLHPLELTEETGRLITIPLPTGL